MPILVGLAIRSAHRAMPLIPRADAFAIEGWEIEIIAQRWLILIEAALITIGVEIAYAPRQTEGGTFPSQLLTTHIAPILLMDTNRSAVELGLPR